MTHIFDWWNNLRQISVKKQVTQQGQHRCQSCGKSAAEEATLEINQIIPSSRGGRYEIDNLQLVCSECRSDNSTTID
ncbi:MAG: HNH endonuclease [Anaerolineales bacterium]